MRKIEELRSLYGKPLKVSSAARCSAHNMKVSATGSDGPHTKLRAIDFLIARKEAFVLLSLVSDMGKFTGIGINQKGDSRFLHLDDLPDAPGQPRPTIWSY